MTTATRPHLTLTISDDPSLLRVVRLAARSLAADVGLDLHAIDDVALAVDELTAALMDVAEGDVTIRFSWDEGDTLHVTGSCPAAAGPELSQIALAILDNATRAYAVSNEGGAAGFTMSASAGRDD